MLAKDSKNFEEQYQVILNYYQSLVRTVKKENYRQKS